MSNQLIPFLGIEQLERGGVPVPVDVIIGHEDEIACDSLNKLWEYLGGSGSDVSIIVDMPVSSSPDPYIARVRHRNQND